MINLALRTEYSFKKCFGKLENVFNHTNDQEYLGIADINGTYGHPIFEKLCKQRSIKPIFGVRLMVVEDKHLRTRSHYGPEYLFIAKNVEGLHELYKLVKSAYENFYYVAQLPFSVMANTSNNLFVIAKNFIDPARIDYIALTVNTCKLIVDYEDLPKVFINENSYSYPWDKGTYQAFCGARKHGEGFRYLFEDQTYPKHILTESEFLNIYDHKEAVKNTYVIAEQCDVQIPKAPMIRYTGKDDINDLCMKGAIKKEVPLDEPEYKQRYEYELKLIKEKDYIDYFLIVADAVNYAKKKMLVGPARGSAAGSLICYLLSITEVDPIKHKLLFERFIDVNRFDLPDIDIDFPDHVRQDVIKYVIKKYGKDNVCHIANINKMRARSAIDEFGMSLSVPKYEIDLVKDSIVDRSGGDARAKIAAADTLKTTEVGKALTEKYPEMLLALEAEDHAVHASVHAAGVIVCNEEITKFGGLNTKDNSIMMDKKIAEDKNLLKIDFLGLRTLTILEDAAKAANLPIHHYYKIPLDDEKTYKLFNEMRLAGIFQFEGQAMKMLCQQMGVHNFNDVVAITALCRPGPLHSGGAAKFVKRRTGAEEAEYLSNHDTYIESTKETYGIVVYQEQLMNLARKCGKMTWEEVAELRRAASKTLGKEFFDKYKNSFMKGTEENQIEENIALKIWDSMMTFGSWAMNLSHAVSYGYISYWCAYMKAHYPLEFAMATLNHSKNEKSSIKLLRDFVENDEIEYIAFDPDESMENWTIKNGKLLGGLLNMKGIADKKAKEIVFRRKMKTLTPAMAKFLFYPQTNFDILYPCKHYFGAIYDDPNKFGLTNAPTLITDINNEEGSYLFIGQITKKDLRDLNEYNEVVKRGGKYLESDSLFLRLIVEDDTEDIFCRINRYNFEKMNGQHLYETLIEEKTWVIVRGSISNSWRVIDIKNIMILPLDYCKAE